LSKPPLGKMSHAQHVWDDTLGLGPALDNKANAVCRRRQRRKCQVYFEMSNNVQLFFLDFGLSIAQNGTLQGRILTCDGNGQNLRPVIEDLRALPGMCPSEKSIPD
jgi:hypothetical protein